jgi:hypothetical protein
MSRWAMGANRVTALLEVRHLQRVVADADAVDALLSSAQKHLGSARLDELGVF